jgi:hypothetical protein
MTSHVKPHNFAVDNAKRTSPTVTRIYLTLGRFDRKRGQTYNAHLGSPDGERIVADALDVEFAACRALKARGVTGRVETWRAGSTSASLFINDIDEAAEMTVREDATRVVQRVKYRPWSGARVSSRQLDQTTDLHKHVVNKTPTV